MRGLKNPMPAGLGTLFGVVLRSNNFFPAILVFPSPQKPTYRIINRRRLIQTWTCEHCVCLNFDFFLSLLILVYKEKV